MHNQSSTPAISVIVPVYNAEKYLHRCIDSVLAQTYTDFELLLIDDGSKDKSGEICDEYAQKDSRVRVFHKENGGVSSARNLGLDNAKGEWITFVDSDDWVDIEWLQTIFENIPKYHGLDIVRYGYTCHQDDGMEGNTVKAITARVATNTENFVVYSEESQYYEMVWNTLIRLSVVGDIRFKIDIQWSEDYIFMYECFAKSKKMLILDKALYHYRNRDDGLSTVVPPERIIRAIGQNYRLSIKLLESPVEKDKKRSNYLYHSRKAVSSLYTDLQVSRKRRYELRKLFVQSNDVRLPLILYIFAYIRPFVFADLLLVVFYQLKKYIYG